MTNKGGGSNSRRVVTEATLEDAVRSRAILVMDGYIWEETEQQKGKS
jgi:hypothetical protein